MKYTAEWLLNIIILLILMRSVLTFDIALSFAITVA